MKKSYTINEINAYYEDVIEEGVEKGLFKHKGEGLMLIGVMCYCGIDLLDHEKILFLLEKIQEFKHKEITDKTSDDYWMQKADNPSIVYSFIREYYPSDKKGNYEESHELNQLSLTKIKKVKPRFIS